jgi:hypothetical protein
MTGFPEFYASGGGFMHMVSVLGLLSILFALKGFAIFKWGDAARIAPALRRAVRTSFDLGLATIGVGALGACMGLANVGHRVSESPAEGDALVRVLAQSLSWTISPLIWALMLIIPVVVMGVILRRRLHAE